MNSRCDFCSEAPVVHVYGAPDFAMQRAGPAVQVSTGGWAACAVCHELIEADDRAALSARSLGRMISLHPELLTQPGEARLRAQIRKQHAAFFAHRAESAAPPAGPAPAAGPGLTFTDLTLVEGAVHSRRLWDTRELASTAIEECRAYLRQLRDGTGEAAVAYPGLDLRVRLGLEAPFPEAPGNDRFFSVGEAGGRPWQYNLVIGRDTPEPEGEWGLVTLLGISLFTTGGAGMTPSALEETVPPLYELRPLVAATLLPQEGLSPAAVLIAADFATCFAAAWLLDEAA